MIDVQVSVNTTNWFSIFQSREMLVFDELSRDAAFSDKAPLFYMRIQPDMKIQAFTAVVGVVVSVDAAKKTYPSIGFECGGIRTSG